MGLKSLFMVSIAIFLPACSHVEVAKVSEKLIPDRVKETANITQVQTPTQSQQAPTAVQTNSLTKRKKVAHYNHTQPQSRIIKSEKQAILSSLWLTEAAKKIFKKSTKQSSKKEPKKASTKTIASFQEGKASYYSSKLHGRKTASGEIYNENKLTAAHKHLPFGTKVRVINKSNGRSVLVSINDRGPFVKKRILDLSYVAAKQLNMLRAGVSNIKMEILQ